MAKFDKKLAAILVKGKLLTEEQKESMLADSERQNVSLVEVILEKKVCGEGEILAAVSQEMNLHPINLSKVKPQQIALEKLTEEQCKTYQVLPVAKLGKILTVAVANPFDVLILDDVKLV